MCALRELYINDNSDLQVNFTRTWDLIRYKITFRTYPWSCPTVNHCKSFRLKDVHSGTYHQTFNTGLPMSFTIYVYVQTQFETSRSISKTILSPFKVHHIKSTCTNKPITWNHCAKTKIRSSEHCLLSWIFSENAKVQGWRSVGKFQCTWRDYWVKWESEAGYSDISYVEGKILVLIA